MGWKHVESLLFFVLFSLPTVRCVTCRWPGSILSENACYLYNSTAVTYFQAKNACQSIGGVLAAVKTLTQLIESTAKAPDYSSLWIGADDIAVEGTWVWEADGTEATELSGFWQYDRSQPDNFSAPDDCAELFVTSSTNKRIWDAECETEYPFLCMEKDLLTTGSTTAWSSSTPAQGSQSSGQSITTTSAFMSSSTPLTTSRPPTTTTRDTTSSVETTIKTTTKCGNGVVTTDVKFQDTFWKNGAGLTKFNMQSFITVLTISLIFY